MERERGRDGNGRKRSRQYKRMINGRNKERNYYETRNHLRNKESGRGKGGRKQKWM